ncbi:barstar family protein [Facklamia miroungae]|uniref:Barstar, RNAse (Barnase) inhibitor n=1 Tax=Facklamia miroungae TaxID=120956 RepID=A0A1G7QKY4_9LACT|nr:barstar family protein [Facklamia miroungae]NKZ28953.1 barstar family protein [Facklamia miroungae]SDF98290.1 Barstar, RNAse (barnase) inhibitor [Facklamia miroungae]
MKVLLDGQAFRDKETTYIYLINRLNLPTYTGYNLDALWDVLGDSQPLEIEIYRARLILDQLGDYGRAMLDLLGDASIEFNHEIILRW